MCQPASCCAPVSASRRACLWLPVAAALRPAQRSGAAPPHRVPWPLLRRPAGGAGSDRAALPRPPHCGHGGLTDHGQAGPCRSAGRRGRPRWGQVAAAGTRQYGPHAGCPSAAQARSTRSCCLAMCWTSLQACWRLPRVRAGLGLLRAGRACGWGWLQFFDAQTRGGAAHPNPAPTIATPSPPLVWPARRRLRRAPAARGSRHAASPGWRDEGAAVALRAEGGATGERCAGSPAGALPA